jgi:hypothetical protein
MARSHLSTSPNEEKPGRRATDGYSRRSVVLATLDLTPQELRGLTAGPSPLVRSRRGRVNWGDAVLIAFLLGRGLRT